MPKTSIFVKLELKDRVGDEIDIDLERQNLSKLFDSTLREAGLGYWSGSAHRSGALVFYFMVNDVDLAGAAIGDCFGRYEHRSQFKKIKIKRM